MGLPPVLISRFQKVLKKYSDIIDCHGGVTYCEPEAFGLGNDKLYVLGWDYAHTGDYYGGFYAPTDEATKIAELLELPTHCEGKKWTTEEIYKEVKNVALQIKTCKNVCEDIFKMIGEYENILKNIKELEDKLK